ncbi:hypothetical protein LBMAG53_39650 [Planctomycetota bacterium]|nr:hypothetical protein LBMAG53_39650 [Planctomycetota bacterium]
MQKRLLARLCLLPENANIDLDWLKATWAEAPGEWVRRFWENDKGGRAKNCKIVAGASQHDKRAIISCCRNHLRYAEVYKTGSFSLHKQDWTENPFTAVKNLLIDFYDPYFYKGEGYPGTGPGNFTKDTYLAALSHQISVCPYTDESVHLIKMDHFLPKEEFPILSCHPDNLISCSTDANSGQIKGRRVPLDMGNASQAGQWLHPRLRPAATGTKIRHNTIFRIRFHIGLVGLKTRLEAKDPSIQKRIDKFQDFFKISEFWSKNLDDEVQGLSGSIADTLRDYGLPPTAQNICKLLKREHRRARRFIGCHDRGIVTAAFIWHVLASQSLFEQVKSTCERGT